MKYSTAALLSAFVSTSLAATIPAEPWTTLTPTASALPGATTDHTHTFGIQIITVTDAISSSEPSATGAAKRDVVNQIGDGQIQKQTTETLATPTPTTTAAHVVNQIGDGQIQHQTAETAHVVNQIGDGQIQHQTAETAHVVNQIGDGQIQHQTTSTATPASVVNQIGDGQIQHQTTLTTKTVASQINDGQVQNATDAAEEEDAATNDSTPQACLTSNSLSMNLDGSVLTDSHGRIGAIVANRQFQFDGPPPQAGSIYAAGWSITEDGYLAIGDQDLFYQCLSGDFYNLYDQNVAEQCSPVKLSIIDLVSC